MKDSMETQTKIKDQAQAIEINSILQHLEELEGHFTQLEITLKDTVTFDTLAARITGKKIAKKRSAKREWSPEEKAAFHASLVAARQAKEKARQEAVKDELKKK